MGSQLNLEKKIAASINDDGVTLHLKTPITLPVEAESICPDRFVGCHQSEILALPIFYGRRRKVLGDLFSVQGEASDQVTVEGDLTHFKRIGQGMSCGRLTLRGDAGMHLGAYMKGGEICVEGSTHDWTGAHMTGGMIRVHGNAGHYTGAAYPGEVRGVNRGTIIVHGDVGNEAGARMRRGLIVVGRNTGECTGVGMIAGSVFVFGKMGARAGAGNKRGSIVALGETAPMLPTYQYQCRTQFGFLGVYLRQIRDWGIAVSDDLLNGYFRRFSGDVTALNKGEILIHD